MSLASIPGRSEAPVESDQPVERKTSLATALRRLQMLSSLVGEESSTEKLGTFLQSATPGGIPEYQMERVRWMREGPMQQFVIALAEIRTALEAMQPEERSRFATLQETYDSAKAAYNEWERLNALASIPDSQSPRFLELLEGAMSQSSEAAEDWATRIDWSEVRQMCLSDRQEKLVLDGKILIDYFRRALIYCMYRPGPPVSDLSVQRYLHGDKKLTDE